MKFSDYQKVKTKLDQTRRELDAPLDRCREEEGKLAAAFERCWNLSHRYSVVFRPDFAIGYIEVRDRPGYTYKTGDGVWSADPRPGMLTPEELILLAKIKQCVARWIAGEGPLPPSDET